NGTLDGTLALNNANGSYAGVMSGAGGLTVNGGTQTLTGNNSYTGLTTIGSNAGLALGDGGTSGLASGTSAFHNDGVLNVNHSDTVTIGQVISGAGSLNQIGSGLTVLTGNNSYTGLTTIGSNASLALGDGGTSGLASGTSAFHNDGVLNVNHSDTVTIGQVISGAGSLNQIGSGLTVLTGNNSYTGATDVSTGALQVDGDQSGATGVTSVASGAQLGGAGTIGGNVSIADNGILSPGDGTHGVGTLTINGNLTLANNAIQNWDLGQAYAEGGQYNDLVRVKGDMTFGGTLNVTGVANGTSVVPVDSRNGLGRGVYRIYTYDGALSGAQNGKLGTVDTAPGTSLALQTSINHQINLVVSDGTLSFWDG
ncbi:autotransporter-associated beta strand repeat-containing protein, partial [Asaia spathodeae]